MILSNNKINNNLHNQCISNGEASDYENNKSDKLIGKKLLLITNSEKNKTKSQTLKNVYKFYEKNINNNNINEPIVNEYKNRTNIFDTKRSTKKSKTIKIMNIAKKQDNSFFKFFKPELTNDISTNKTDKIEKNVFPKKRSKRNSFAITLNKEKNLFNITNDKNKKSFKHYNTKNTFNFPSLPNQKLKISEKTNINNNIESKKVLYKSVNNKVKKYYSLEKNKKNNNIRKSVNTFGGQKIRHNKTINDIINKNPLLFSKLEKKKASNDLNMKLKNNLIYKKLFNKYNIKDRKSKFLKEFKTQIEHKNRKNEKQTIIKEERQISVIFIENKVKEWMFASPLKDPFESDQNIIFNMKEDKKYKKKEINHIRIIAIDFIKRISSSTNISYYYLNYHKGIIEKEFLIHIRDKFFDIILPSSLLENGNDENAFNFPKKSIQKILLRQKNINNKKRKLSPTQKRGRRLSSVASIKEGLYLYNIIPPLNEIEKKYILYYYYLDLDLEENEYLTKIYDNLNFLDLLRGEINRKEKEDLLINRFISNYIKKNGNKNIALSYKKKNSIKNNILANKCSNDLSKNKKLSLFKNNFFSRNEIKCSEYKNDTIIKKKKSVLEYNLLFDPNLNGYNNLIGDPKTEIQPNSERTYRSKSKLKEMQNLKNKQLASILISSGGMKTDKNIYVMKTLDLKNQYNHKNKGNINSLISSIKDCNYESFEKFYRTCNCGPNARDKEGNSLLSLAVKSSCLEIVNFLLNEKANPNIQNVRLYYIII